MFNLSYSAPISYPHRRNWDRSYDSICPRCYRTIANRRSELDLAEQERLHVCEKWRLDMLQDRRQPMQTQ